MVGPMLNFIPMLSRNVGIILFAILVNVVQVETQYWQKVSSQDLVTNIHHLTKGIMKF